MEKYIYDQANGLWFERNGEYYIPCLMLPEVQQYPLGIWGRKHLRYLKEHRPARYVELLLSGKLNEHLAQIDICAAARYDTLVKQFVKERQIGEQLKEKNQMAWGDEMNNIRNSAEEIVNTELIYT